MSSIINPGLPKSLIAPDIEGFCSATIIVDEDEATVGVPQEQKATSSETVQEDEQHISTPQRRVISRLKEQGVPSPMTRTVVSWQEQFSPERRGGSAIHFHQTATNPTVFASPGNVYVRQNAIGRGAEAQVYNVLQFPRDGSSPDRKVAKFARRSFIAQRKAQLSLSPSGKKHINMFESTSSVLGQKLYIGIVTPADCDLEHLNLSGLRLPVSTTVSISKDIAAGMASVHRSGQIHRDLKPANIVIIKKDNGFRAQVTDFGLVTRERTARHATCLTPTFAGSFVWNSILDQRDRNGIQNKKGDVFSLGRTLLNGGVLKLLKHYGESRGISLQEHLQQLVPVVLPLPNSNEELLKISADAEGPVIIGFRGAVPSTVYLFPSQDKLGNVLRLCVSELKSVLPSREFEMLKKYVELVVSLQSEDPDALPTMEETHSRLQAIITESTPPAPVLNLRDEDECMVEPRDDRKRRMTSEGPPSLSKIKTPEERSVKRARHAQKPRLLFPSFEETALPPSVKPSGKPH